MGKVPVPLSYERRERLRENGWPSHVTADLPEMADDILDALCSMSIGPMAGPHFHPSAVIVYMAPLALDLLALPGIANLRLWYDRYDDFTHVGFDLDRDHYDVRLYKVYSVAKNHCDAYLKMKQFQRYRSKVITFFQRGHHRKWEIPRPALTMEESFRRWCDAYVDRAENSYGEGNFTRPTPYWRDGMLYLGYGNDLVEWDYGIKPTGDPAPYQLVHRAGAVLATAEQFYTICEYAMQQWKWAKN